ncbi:MAG: GDP-mannose 4,6-dehydratase, partial [Armatimonadota bacterium]
IIQRSALYLKLGRIIELHGGGTAVKSYIHIRDVSRGELAILDRGQVGSLYHLSPDQGIAVRDVVRLVCERLGVSFEEATTVVAERLGQDAAYVIESTKARTELGWSPQVSIEEGLSEVVSWVEANWDEIMQQPLEYQHKP